VIEFPMSSPDGVVVNIGCGMDSRFSRINNGRVCFHDLDLPEVPECKRRFFEATDSYHFIPPSVLLLRYLMLVVPLNGGFIWDEFRFI
jgi:O-methyltransferase involved in polyketide biosynthesis